MYFQCLNILLMRSILVLVKEIFDFVIDYVNI